uniref:DNA-directed RNA polymerase subunit beta n=2 Tax=Pyropia yezoensis TaxID=2788 RepID=RPOB_PYRYE|nr:RNA polymerase beta subunit [Neopyropia yezoensis]Q1XDN5.1 RecName: Full=DNA-directed RNA polymerase subunit beta; AltName: Full=PEP; AltName: Full=Plastid-encoded RNA polymerase subunit beta; Short=RNA polymerase subunit beta [Neopyropia yezoensis]AGH27577.1 RNA polymerase beta subunit [Neopyropia yezoensis]QFZ66913.1 RNA polymerase beta subunit [Neopyropia yezoensis]ULU28899.1 RNA polymerase beta subunit [Neopyropia yezoensis]BAE92376.1 DNA-directed RNA polymerase beta chain [Neopyropia y
MVQRISLKNKLLPDLVEIQRASFKWFLLEGLTEVLEIFPKISDPTSRLELQLFGNEYKIKFPRYSVRQAKNRDKTYSAQIYVPAKLTRKDIDLPSKNQEKNIKSLDLSSTHLQLSAEKQIKNKKYKKRLVFIGDLPIMTNRGTFIVSGTERVIINQIIRSPGIYYKQEIDKNGKQIYSASLISNRGSWLKFEIDPKGEIWIRIDKTHKVNAYIFLRAIGLNKDEIEKGLSKYAFLISASQIYSVKELAKEIGKNNIEEVTDEEALLIVYSKLRPNEPATVAVAKQMLYSRFFDPKRYDLGEVGRYKINKKLGLNIPKTFRVLSPQDILSSIDYLINIKDKNSGNLDDIDHLGNRRVRSVGELLQNQFRVGLNRLERIIRERMMICDIDSLSLSNLINPKPLIASVREFFGSSQLSQFMDQTNPVAELTHKRRISALGPGGFNKDRAGFAVRDLHPSHYGRICPIETPEGPNAGLIGSLATCARVNVFGFIETPFYPVNQGQVIYHNSPVYLTADEEDDFRVAPGDVKVSKQHYIEGDIIPVRYRQEFITTTPTQVDYIAISPIQVISAATSLIPFLEHDDANRALMGSNMQRQAVPLLYPEKPIIGTGLETKIARDSGMVVISRTSGHVNYVSANKIGIQDNSGRTVHYRLKKYYRSNQDTCINQRPIVWVGEKIVVGQTLADGASTDGGEIALGRNILVAYMPWEGYNYEDAFLISERLVYDDLYTSIHIEKYEVECRQTKLGPEEITREIPNVSDNSLKDLDRNGIVVGGSWVEAGDILVGKITPKGEADQLPEGKLLRAIFGEKARDVRDTSLRLPNAAKGRVVKVRVFTRQKGDELPPGTNAMIRVYVAQKRKIQVGDKMAGRHGNKGIISRILPKQDMPYLSDGTPVDIVLNPLGVPSRMNVGQVFECLLGLAGGYLGKRFKIIPFDEMYGAEASRALVNRKLKEASLITSNKWLFNDQHPGKMQVFDGRTGEPFDNPVTVGRAYMLKLVHLVDDKIHARSTGPYSLVTQQPLGGRAQHGGQRLGEMEVWALEAFGAAYTLQELLTVKSDDMQARNEALNAIVKGKPIPKPGTPESFKVLMRELQSLGLDIAVHKLKLFEDGQRRTVEVDLMSDSKDNRVDRSNYDTPPVDDFEQFLY